MHSHVHDCYRCQGTGKIDGWRKPEPSTHDPADPIAPLPALIPTISTCPICKGTGLVQEKR
jgi:hypothetical protein